MKLTDHTNACNSLTRKLWESDDTCLENQLKSNLVNLFLEGFSQFEPLCASGERAIPAPQRRQFKRHYNYYLELARVLWVTNKVSLPVFKEVNNYILLSFLSLTPRRKGLATNHVKMFKNKYINFILRDHKIMFNFFFLNSDFLVWSWNCIYLIQNHLLA